MNNNRAGEKLRDLEVGTAAGTSLAASDHLGFGSRMDLPAGVPDLALRAAAFTQSINIS